MINLKANDTETPLLNEARGQVGDSACSLEVIVIYGLDPINCIRLLHLDFLVNDCAEVLT